MIDTRTIPPPDDLAPYVRRFFLIEADFSASDVVEDFLLAETAVIRILLRGEWSGDIEPGRWSRPGCPIFFGANAHPLNFRVKGKFAIAGCDIRARGWRALFREPHSRFVDDVMPLRKVWGKPVDTLQEDIARGSTDEAAIDALQAALRRRVAEIGKPEPDLQMARFEAFARNDSMIRVEEAAEALGLSMRQLARRCKAAFGMTPKAVLRRSRFLDMAAAMRGFSTSSEQDLAALRYYDQSHLGREFKRFTNMTPGEFDQARTPLQTASLQLREASRYED